MVRPPVRRDSCLAKLLSELTVVLAMITTGRGNKHN
jgi:hypothetical protein